MRVLKLIDGLGVGGAEQYVLRVAPRLRELGIEVEVCALDAGGALREAFETAGLRPGGTRYPDRLRRSHTLVLGRTVADIRSRLLQGRFDAVHTYLFWSDVLGSAAGRLAGLRRVIVTRRALYGWRFPAQPVFRSLNAASNLMATEVIANSKAVLRDAAAHERTLPRRRAVIYNGVDAAQFTPGRPPVAGPLQLLSVGALQERKGHEVALDALRLVREAGQEVRLTIVGEGPDEGPLQRHAEAAGVAGWVRITGRSQDPRPFLASSHLFVLASRQEGFSNALLEAMAAGLPAVVTDVGGNAEALDPAGGRVVPPNDPDALGRAILEMAGDRDRLRAAGAANRARVLSTFTIDDSARRLRDWYLERESPE